MHRTLDLHHCQTNNHPQLLKTMSKYYFDGSGKGIRLMISLAMAQAINCHLFGINYHAQQSPQEELLIKQCQVAIIAEMYHTSSLYHDDVIDKSEERRGCASVNSVWGARNSIMSGDYIIAMAYSILGQISNDEVSLMVILCNIVHYTDTVIHMNLS